jgi:periodic tryptophan protein 2
VAKLIPSSPHVQFYLKWVTAIISQHGALDNGLSQQTLVTLHQNLNHKYELLSRVCDFNKYTLQTLKGMAALRSQQDMVSGHSRYKQLRSSEAEEDGSENDGDENMGQVRREAMDLSMSEDSDADGSEE